MWPPRRPRRARPASARQQPLKHFGITAGYGFLYFRLEDTVRNRTFTVKQTLHGPLAGIGLYFWSPATRPPVEFGRRQR